MSRPWMPLYVADYLRDTRHLTAAEHGAYLLLIMQYWTAGSLPSDDARLARIASMSEAEWREARPIIAELFEPGWRHKRIDDELAKSAEKYERRSEAGKRGVAARQKPSNAEANAEQNDQQTTSNAQASSSQPQPLDRIGDARAREQSAFTEGAKARADAFYAAVGFDDPLKIPPEFYGVLQRAMDWEKSGFSIAMIEAQARKLARDRPLKPLIYFEKVFATEHAKLHAPLPVVEVRQAENLTVTRHGTAQSGTGIIQAADSLNAALDAFDEGAGSGAEELRSEARPPPVRLLSQG